MGILFLYDIDGTLLNTQGAGRESMNLAFLDVFGVEDAFRAIHFAGRTDLGITRDAFEHAGIDYTSDSLAALKSAYEARLAEALARAPERVVLCPGVREAMAATAEIGTNALLTGNWRSGAQLKLEVHDLWSGFLEGAFGEDSPNRDDLVPVAEARCRDAGASFDRTIVIGDTRADISCARAGGATAVAVLTGWAGRDALEGARPDLLLEDLERGLPALLALGR